MPAILDLVFFDIADVQLLPVRNHDLLLEWKSRIFGIV